VHTGRFIFSQVVDFIPERDFRRIVAKYRGDYKTSTLSSWDHLLALSFAMLTFRESLRDIEDCLRPRQQQLYHLGFRGSIARSTLADANATRDFRIFEELALLLVAQAQRLSADEPSGVDELEATIYAIDSTTIDLCLSIFPWARFRRSKAAVKVHTQLALRGPLPVLVEVTNGKVHDVNWLDSVRFELGCFYLLDRGYIDFVRLWVVNQAGAYFVTRAKSNMQFYRCHSHPPQGEGVIADQIIQLTGPRSKEAYPARLRRVVYRDPETGKLLVFLTNNFDLPALTIALLYKARWNIELFFKWLKMNVRIKAFFGREPNAVKIQIWCALAVHALLLIIRHRLRLKSSLHSILAVLSVSIFEQVDIHELFTDVGLSAPVLDDPNLKRTRADGVE
jgi:Domain of unknown function (DUF4372)/Transposase DDE domain